MQLILMTTRKQLLTTQVTQIECLERLREQANPAVPATLASGESIEGYLSHTDPRQILMKAGEMLPVFQFFALRSFDLSSIPRREMLPSLPHFPGPFVKLEVIRFVKFL